MRANNKIPRIIKILKIVDHQIYCAFNNGEYRIIDFKQLFKKWKTNSKSFESPLKNEKDFKKVKLNSGTLSWPHITKTMKLPDGQTFETFLDFDPVVMYENSVEYEKLNQRYQIGQMLKSERIKAGLTQEELAIRSGTTKNYISRIENNKSDIELKTLRKIIEIGMSKKLEIAVS
jgi:DNA-binding XRE family transcriptional regulator